MKTKAFRFLVICVLISAIAFTAVACRGEVGEKGDTGNGISNIVLSQSEGLVDTYTITYTNGATSTFTVTNGERGEKGIQGERGKDGVTPTIEISDDGYWIINGEETRHRAIGKDGENGETGEVNIETVKEFINFFEFEEIEIETEQGFYNANTGTFREHGSYKSAKIPVISGEIYAISGCVYKDLGGIALVTYLDESDKVLGKEFASVIGATEHSIYTDEIIIAPPNTAYLALSTYCVTGGGSPLVVKKVKDKSILEYVSGITPLLSGKTIVNFGDSIFGNAKAPNDISTMLAQLTGATVYNCGFGGCRMSKHGYSNYDAFGMYNLASAIANNDFTLQDTAIIDTEVREALPSYFKASLETLKTIDFSKVDIITIAYGTNDWTGGKTIDSEEETHSTNTYAGALRYSIETLCTAYPHIQIFVCTPTWRFWHTDGTYTEDSDTKVLGGTKLTDFVDKTVQVAREYHLKVIDNYNELGINKFNRTNYFPATDGTHHNLNGRILIARHIANELF